MNKKVLVIEDDEKHLADAHRYFERVRDVEVLYATTYEDASKRMFKIHPESGTSDRRYKGDLDGIISDIYFPLTTNEQWNQPEPIGIRVALNASRLNIPFVLNTAGYHHGRRYYWINGLAREEGWSIIDPLDILRRQRKEPSYETDAPFKNWEEAYRTLQEKMK